MIAVIMVGVPDTKVERSLLMMRKAFKVSKARRGWSELPRQREASVPDTHPHGMKEWHQYRNAGILINSPPLCQETCIIDQAMMCQQCPFRKACCAGRIDDHGWIERPDGNLSFAQCHFANLFSTHDHLIEEQRTPVLVLQSIKRRGT